VLLTISTTHDPATDLGYLLHKHPSRVQEFPQSFGMATVFYPEATDERCTVALLLDVDPIRLARGRARNSPDFSLAQYVNDRSYAASSLLGVALADVFSTARAGRCAARQELADSAIPLEIAIPVLPCRGGPEVARRVFEPLGWAVEAEPIALDEAFPEWGDSRYARLCLRGAARLADALNQLYALLPVLLMPLLLPLLIAGIHGTMDALAGAPFATWRAEIAVVAGYDVAMLAASWLLFDQAVG